MYVCFIDLQRAHDSVDGELLREVLARFVVPAKILASTYPQAPPRHVGLHACVRTTVSTQNDCASHRGFAGLYVIIVVAF